MSKGVKFGGAMQREELCSAGMSEATETLQILDNTTTG